MVPWKHLQGSALQVRARAGTQHRHPLPHTTTVTAREPKSRKKSSTSRWRSKEELCDSPPKGSKERRGSRPLRKAFSLPSRAQHLPVSKLPGQSLSAPLPCRGKRPRIRRDAPLLCQSSGCRGGTSCPGPHSLEGSGSAGWETRAGVLLRGRCLHWRG